MHKPANTLEPFQHTAAKVVGFFYLFTNATAIAAFSIRGKLMVMRDAAQTAANIAGSERLFRVGIALELITVAGVLALLWGLYVVLRPVDRNLVWLGGFLRSASWRPRTCPMSDQTRLLRTRPRHPGERRCGAKAYAWLRHTT